MSSEISFTLSSDEYRVLAKLVFLGEWMANANREEPSPEYEALAERVYGLSVEAGAAEYVGVVGSGLDPSGVTTLEMELAPVIQQYDEDAFWQELVERLSLRDFMKKYSAEEIDGMSEQVMFARRMELADHYESIFGTIGLDCLHVVTPPPMTIQIN